MLSLKASRRRSVSSIVEMSLEVGVSTDMVLRWLLEAGYTKLEAEKFLEVYNRETND